MENKPTIGLQDILRGREKQVIIMEVHGKFNNKWSQDREKFLYKGSINMENLRSIFPEEIIIEFDHKEKEPGYSFEKARDEAIAWIRKIQAIFQKNEHWYYITDHKGKSPHFRTQVDGLQEQPHEIRSRYKKRLAEMVLNAIRFDSKFLNPDWGLLTKETALIPVETAPHWKPEYKNNIEEIICEFKGKRLKLTEEDIDNIKKEIELEQGKYQDNPEENVKISFKDVKLEPLKEVWKKYYSQGMRNKLVMALSACCFRRGISSNDAVKLLKLLNAEVKQTSELPQRIKELKNAYKTKKRVAAHSILEDVLKGKELFEVYGKFKEAFGENETKQEPLKPLTPDELDFLAKGNIIDHAIKLIQRNVVGELKSIRAIFTIAVGGILVSNLKVTSTNLIISDASGAGKDHVVSSVLESLPGKYVIKRKRISPTALTYWHNVENDPSWTWTGKILYLEDISDEILNCEVLKLLMSNNDPIGYSSITVDHKTKDMGIRGKPVVIATTCKSQFQEETIRRVSCIFMDTSEKQTEDITMSIAESQESFNPNPKDEKIEIDFKHILEHLQRVNVIIPFAVSLVKRLDCNRLSLRTDINKVFDFIKFSAAINQYQREKDEQGNVIANGEDYNTMKVIFEATTFSDYGFSLTKAQKVIMDYFLKPVDENGQLKSEADFEEIQNYFPHLGRTILYEHLNNLTNIGALTCQLNHNEYGKRYYVWGAKSTKKLEFPDFEELIKTFSQSGYSAQKRCEDVNSEPVTDIEKNGHRATFGRNNRNNRNDPIDKQDNDIDNNILIDNKPQKQSIFEILDSDKIDKLKQGVFLYLQEFPKDNANWLITHYPELIGQMLTDGEIFECPKGTFNKTTSSDS